MTNILHSGYQLPVTRKWQQQSNELSSYSLMFPVFIHNKRDEKLPIEALPGQLRYGINRLKEDFDIYVKNGLKSVLLFGVPGDEVKNNRGSGADSPDSPVIESIKYLRTLYPQLLVACDVCICAYTSHGHCGILKDDGSLNNEASIKRLAQVSLSFAQAGCQLIAPSDMMDGRVNAIKQLLAENGYGSTVPVMSYSAKFASSFYGPFRAAAGSAPSYGDRKCYQLPPYSRGLAKRAMQRDVDEGADFIMVKPGYPYLDIVRDASNMFPNIPISIYQVSGEYCMLWHAAQAGAIDLRAGVLEAVESGLRAGATVIITYFTPKILEWLTQ